MSYGGEMTREEAHRLKQAADLYLSLREAEREAFRLLQHDPACYLDNAGPGRLSPGGPMDRRLAAEACRFLDGLAEGFCTWAGIERSRAAFVAAELEAGE